MDTFDLLEKYATKVMQSDAYIKKIEQEVAKQNLQMTAMTKSRDFNRERAQKLLQDKEKEYSKAEKNMKMLQAEVEKKASLIKKKEALLKKLRDEKGQDSSEIEGLMHEMNGMSNEMGSLRAKLHTACEEQMRLDGQVLDLRNELNQEKANHKKEKANHKKTKDDLDLSKREHDFEVFSNSRKNVFGACFGTSLWNYSYCGKQAFKGCLKITWFWDRCVLHFGLPIGTPNRPQIV